MFLVSRLSESWRNLSVSKKLYSVVGVMAILIALELVTLVFSMGILSATRGFVGGESMWSKAQKTALLDLQNYIIFRDEKYYQSFLKNLEVPLGDRAARFELEKPNYDPSLVTQGLLQGGNDIADIPSMIKLLRRFHSNPYLARSIEAWRKADALIDEMMEMGTKLHESVKVTPVGQPLESQGAYLVRMTQMNNELTILQDRFSYSLGEASRWLEHTLLFILLLVVLMVESTGIFLTFRFSQSLSHSLNELNASAARIGAGDFTQQIPVRSGDELGQLAQSLNRMTRDLREMTGERKLAEEASQVKSLFLANMSHEIRTPLGAILGFVELLKEPHLTQAEKNQYFDIIARTGEALATIINDILDISKVEAGKVEIDKQTFSLNQLLKDLYILLKLRSDNKGIQLYFVSQDNVPDVIYSDAMRIRQILLNIVGNAIKFTQQGSVTVTYWVEEEFLHFSIKDTGTGISPMDVHKLFKPFAQADHSIRKFYGGTGLGLVLSRELAQLLGGDVRLEQTFMGEGSIFRVTVRLDRPPSGAMVLAAPPKQEPAPPPEDTLIASGEVLKGCKILLVEDVPENQILFCHFLAKSGADVSVAQNGLEGLQLALAEPFAVILMDMQMPVLDGYSATIALREKGYSAPIIGLTAHAMKEDLRKCLQAGCNEVITKPVHRNQLIETVAKHCKKGPPSRGPSQA